MLAELQLELESDQLSVRNSSNLQGFLMSVIDGDYARVLHEEGRHPYSQFLSGGRGSGEKIASETGGKLLWHIQTLNEEAYREIIEPMREVGDFCLKGGALKVTVKKRTLRTLQNRALLEEFYSQDSGNTFQLCFLTPSSFKSRGEYLFYPSPDLIFHSLMEKYSQSFVDFGAGTGMDMTDEDTLKELSHRSRILRYNLRTVPFPMEKVHMIGFAGSLRLRIKGPEVLSRFARMLFRFGEFSGVGIKTGMGMGALRVREIGSAVPGDLNTREANDLNI